MGFPGHTRLTPSRPGRETVWLPVEIEFDLATDALGKN
jgi:hypothetical protein